MSFHGMALQQGRHVSCFFAPFYSPVYIHLLSFVLESSSLGKAPTSLGVSTGQKKDLAHAPR